MNRQKGNWIIDSLLFIGFLISCWLDLTGVELHQWIGMMIGAFVLFHLLLHWSWAKSVTARFFSRTSGQARIFYLIDASLMLGFFLIIVTGLVISTWLALPLGNYLAWKNFHVIITGITLALVVLKIALHWRWVIVTGNQCVHEAPAPASQVRTASPRSTSATLDRRAFLKLMGAVGVMTLVPMTNVLDALAQGASQGIATINNTAANSTSTSTASPAQSVPATNVSSTVTNPTPTPVTSPTQTVVTTNNSTASSCQVQCSNGCSYPGRCRRYTDSNQNGRCDLGECVS